MSTRSEPRAGDADAVFVAHGTWGDVGPLASLAARLAARGARVHFVSTPFFEEGLRARGLAVDAVGAWWDPGEALHDPRLRHPLTGPLDIWRLVYAPLVAPMFEAARASLSARGVVVMHPWCFGAQLAAEAAGRPWVMTALAPVTWFSAAAPPVTGPLRLPDWVARAVMAGPIRWALRGVFNPDLRAEAARRGLPAIQDRFSAATQHAALNLGFWPAWLRPLAADDPPGARLCGFPEVGHAPRALSPSVEAFLRQGAPPVVFGLGSALPAIAPELYDLIEAALRARGLRGVLVGAPDAPREDAQILRVSREPYGALFPRARFVVHHGGIGTCAEALAAGAPQLVIPFGADQYDNARLLERLGVARVCHRRAVTARRLALALEALERGEARFRALAATRAQETLGAAPGLEVAEGLLWGLLREQRA